MNYQKFKLFEYAGLAVLIILITVFLVSRTNVTDRRKVQAAAGATATFTPPPVRVNTATGMQNFPHVAVDGNDISHIIFVTDTFQLMYTNNAGGTFSAPVQVDTGITPGADSQPTLKFINGTFHLAYAAGTSNIYYRTGTFTGTAMTWGAPETVWQQAGVQQLGASLAVDGTGNVHVTWLERSCGTTFSTAYGMRSAATGTWSALTKLINGCTAQAGPRITVTADGKPHVVFEMTNDIYYGTTDATSAWTTRNLSNSPTTNSYNPSITNSGTDIYVAWQEFTAANGHDIFVQRSTDGGQTFTDLAFANNAQDQFYPSIVWVPAANRLYIAWSDKTSVTSGTDAWFNEYDTTQGWAAAVRLSNMPDLSDIPVVSAGTTAISMVWQDMSTNPQRSVFQVAGQIGPPPANSPTPTYAPLPPTLIPPAPPAAPPAATGTFDATITIAGPPAVLPVSKNIWGVNLNGYIPLVDRNQFFTYIDEAKLVELGVQMIRFPGGCPADFYDWKNSSYNFRRNNVNPPDNINRKYLSIDDAIDISTRVGAELLYQINIDDKRIDNYCSHTSLYTGNLLQDARDLVTLYKGRIRYYELGNEQYAPLNPAWTPTEYSQHAIQFAQAIKQIDANARVGIVGYGSGEPDTQRKTDWTNMIKQLITNTSCNGACFDFVTDHPYGTGIHNPAFPGMTAYYPITNYRATFQQQKAAYAPKDVANTEWNLVCWAPNINNPGIGTVEQGMYQTSTLFIMAEEGYSIGNTHDVNVNFDGSRCGLFWTNNLFTPAGQSFALTSVAAGGEVQKVTAAGPTLNIPVDAGCTNNGCLRGGVDVLYVSAYAVRKLNDLYIFVINRHPTDNANMTINYNNFGVTGAKAVEIKRLTATNFTDQLFYEPPVENVQASGQLQTAIPPKSINRIRVVDHFLNAPPPTPTPIPNPSTDLTLIHKLINAKRLPPPPCKPDLLMYIFAVTIYVMMIHFAIQIRKEFKIHIMVTCFVLGGFIGYVLCAMEIGFILGVVLSLFLW